MDETTISQVAPEGMVSPQKGGGSKRIVILAIIALILLGALFAGGKYLRSRGETIPTPTPFPTPESTPTPTPTPELSPTLTPKATPTKKPTPTVSSATTNSKGLTVRVLNGTTVTGRAGAAADFLKGIGYDIAGTGNADTQDYDSTTITIKSSKSDLLSMLKTDLATKYQIGTTSATLAATETYDALVIIGKN